MSINDATAVDWDKMRAKYANMAHSEVDAVNSPEHYNSGEIECIEAIKASMSSEAFKGYLKGNTLKYIWRMSYKGKPEEDLKKSQWYLNKLLEEVS
tara:strand:- start:186 stop:473 length:288 start_codon:yes stop_codon:yes gene_type:complete